MTADLTFTNLVRFLTRGAVLVDRSSHFPLETLDAASLTKWERGGGNTFCWVWIDVHSYTCFICTLEGRMLTTWEYHTLHATTTFEWACWLPSPSWLRHDRSLKSHAPTCVTAVSSRVTHVPRGQWMLGNQTNYIAFLIWPSPRDFLILHFFISVNIT